VAHSGRRRTARAEEGGGSKPAVGDPSTAVAKFTEEDKKRADELFKKAFEAPTVEEEEATWTKLVETFRGIPQVEARASSNRGNSRARQGKLTLALEDYNHAIELGPGEVDGYLNRGVTYEALGRLDEAVNDYNMVLAIDPDDPAAWNNRGNALMGLGKFRDARDSFKTALSISGPQQFAFAAVNLNLVEYELGNDEAVFKDLRAVLARWADAFPDARAAYALLLWDRGDRIEAEAQWDRATTQDPRYRSLAWVKEFRRWPPRIRGLLQRFSASAPSKVK